MRGSDDDSYDDMDEYDQMLSDSDQSDPGWKPYLDVNEPVRFAFFIFLFPMNIEQLSNLLI